MTISQHQPGGSGVEQLHRPLDQQRHEVDDVEVIDESVRQFHHGSGQPVFSSHLAVLETPIPSTKSTPIHGSLPRWLTRSAASR